MLVGYENFKFFLPAHGALRRWVVLLVGYENSFDLLARGLVVLENQFAVTNSVVR